MSRWYRLWRCRLQRAAWTSSGQRSEPKADATGFPSHPDFKPTTKCSDAQGPDETPRTTITRAMFKELANGSQGLFRPRFWKPSQVKQLITL